MNNRGIKSSMKENMLTIVEFDNLDSSKNLADEAQTPIHCSELGSFGGFKVLPHNDVDRKHYNNRAQSDKD
jgi:hypothetical protein